MRSVSISVLKARLSQYLDAVRRGEQVLITDRGQPVASLQPVTGGHDRTGRTDLLVRTGRMRLPMGALPRAFWKQPRPRDPGGRSLEVLLREREEDR